MSYKLSAQQLIIPVQFDQYYQNPVSINPANNNFIVRDAIKLNRRSLSAPFRNVVSLLGSYQHRLSKSDSGRSQIIGFVFQNEKEGGFLNRTRVYGNYSVQLSVNERWNLSAGVSAGLFNYFIKSSTSSAGGGVFIPDGSIGIHMQYKEKYNLGVSLNQLLNNSAVPFGVPVVLTRYVNANFSGRIISSDRMIGKLFVNSRFSDMKNDHRVNFLLGYNNGPEAGLGMVYKRGVLISLGLNSYSLSDRRKMDIGASYFIPTPQYASQIAKALEIFVSLN